MSWFSWRLFQSINFFPLNEPCFPVYLYICDLLLKSEHLNIMMWRLDFPFPSGFAGVGGVGFGLMFLFFEAVVVH